ncbi:MAG: hypothetical protein K0S44_262 [Bacteroidetes bacterium]|jgi:hypothetical protein|nr:hypothetical protein [Bacteroidota bacterium]
MRLSTFILFLFTFLLFSGKAQKEIAQSTEQDGYVQDFNILTTSMRELYPMFYTVQGKEKVEQAIKETFVKLSTAKTKHEALYIIQRFLYGFSDVHASLMIYGDLLVEKALPFKVQIIKDELYIKNFPANPLLNGAKINAIDSHNTKNVIDSLKVLYPVDGNNVMGLVIQPLFNSFYGAFIEQRDSFSINTDKGIITVPCLKRSDPTFNDIIRNSWMSYMVTDKDWMKKEVTDQYGYFRLLSFDKKVNGFKIENEFNSLIAELNKRKVPNLIIDLRYNSGGDPYMAGRIASLLIDQPIKVFEKLIVVKPEAPSFSQYLKIKYPGRTKGVIKVSDHYEKVSGDKGLVAINPSKDQYKGKIYVITGAMTESTSTMLCKYLKGRKDVIFVGSETPGAINYFCAHNHCEVTLPNIGFIAGFGMQLIELENGSSADQKPQGVKPDVAVDYNIEEALLKKDKEMEWILNKLK